MEPLLPSQVVDEAMEEVRKKIGHKLAAGLITRANPRHKMPRSSDSLDIFLRTIKGDFTHGGTNDPNQPTDGTDPYLASAQLAGFHTWLTGQPVHDKDVASLTRGNVLVSLSLSDPDRNLEYANWLADRVFSQL